MEFGQSRYCLEWNNPSTIPDKFSFIFREEDFLNAFLLKYALFPLLKKICKYVNWSENKAPTYTLRVTFKLPLA